MKVLIIGGGGREHALAWKCAAEAGVDEVLVAPGNAGTAAEPRVRNVAVGAEDVAGLVALAVAEEVDLTIVGPEGALVAGVVDAFAARGPAMLRAHASGGATRRLQGLLQGIPAAPPHSDRRLPHLHPDHVRSGLRALTTGPDRRQGQRPRRGQGRRDRDQS